MVKKMSSVPPHSPLRERRYVKVRRVDECATLGDVFLHCLPAFGGASLRRIHAEIQPRMALPKRDLSFGRVANRLWAPPSFTNDSDAAHAGDVLHRD